MTPKLLTVLRHAKSDWLAGQTDDHARPLNARGKRDLPEMAARWRSGNPVPDVILSSTAARAQSTAAGFASAIGFDSEQIEYDRALYLPAPATVLAQAHAAAGAEHVLIVAHNPGLTQLVNQLTDARLNNLPTCAWATIDLAGARLVELQSPKGLIDVSKA